MVGCTVLLHTVTLDYCSMQGRVDGQDGQGWRTGQWSAVVGVVHIVDCMSWILYHTVLLLQLTTLCRVVCAVPQYMSTQLPQLLRLLCEVNKIDAPKNVTHKVARQQIIDRLVGFMQIYDNLVQTTLEQRIATIDSRALVAAIEGMTNTDDWVRYHDVLRYNLHILASSLVHLPNSSRASHFDIV